MKYGLYIGLVLGTLLFSCNNDDDGLDVIAVEADLLSEVAPEDDAEIREFLQTHFYNYEEFEAPPADFDFKIRIDTIAGDNADKTPLIDREELKSATLNVSSEDFGLDHGEENVEHTYYYLEARAGGGGSPTYADSTLLKYRGTLLDGTLFDENQVFSWQELPFTIRGYAHGVSSFKAGTSDQIVENGDGTFTINNSGIGMFFLPSGLAYFNTSQSTTITAYSILLFEVEIGAYIEDTDSDNDGVPSILEDLNGDGDLTNDNTDEEDELSTFGITIPNFQDGDDDGDGVSTNDEITDDDGNIVLPYPDSDGDGTPDYLDPDTN